MANFPAYRDLKRPDDSGLPLSWGTWGAGDQIGTINHITGDKVREAAKLVRTGKRFNLDLPLHVPFGEIKEKAHATRRAPKMEMHQRTSPDRMVRDDKMDEFYLQCSSQWDGLTHMGDVRQGRFYNGVKPEQVLHGEGSRNGIEHLAEFGVASRGVLADLPRYFKETGRAWDMMAGQVASAKDLQACLDDQGVKLEPGDVLMARMGWVADFRAAKDVEARDALFRPWKFSGLSGEEDMWEFIWDHKLAALASDTVTVEVWPIKEGRPSLHLAIARLGITIGEMFDFEALAEDCARDKEYRSFFVSSPLNVRGGVGSPPNAMAIK
jgi:kynurenine formamidase